MRKHNLKSNKNLKNRWGKPTDIIEGIDFNIESKSKDKKRPHGNLQIDDDYLIRAICWDI